MRETPSQLKPQFADHAATFLEIICSTVGGPAGGFFGAMIGRFIPGQIQERLIEYVAQVKAALDARGADFDQLASRVSAAEIDLFNLGAQTAARSRSNERIGQVAAVVARGLSEDEAAAADAERLLSLLGDVSESDVAALCALSPTYAMAENFFRLNPRAAVIRHAHAPGFVRQHRTLADGDPSPEEVESVLMMNFQLGRLEMLGLLERPAGNIPYGGAPPKPGNYRLTSLGRYVLTQLGVIVPPDARDRLRPSQQG